jgi:hypothetical protein
MSSLTSLAEMIGETRPNVSFADIGETRVLRIAHSVKPETIRREAGRGVGQA